MTAVGPYEFTDEDVLRTLFHGRTLFDLLPGGFPPDPHGPAAPFRARAEAALDDADPAAPEVALRVVWDERRGAIAALRAAGAFGAPAVGSVTGLFVSDGGVPKQARDSVEVTFRGVVGDRQDDRTNHGRPWQALCLWSNEVIDGFVAQGHPLAPGLAGENITMAGLPWERVVPGCRLQIGDVLAEVSAYAVPCQKNAAWFIDGHFGLMHHRHGPISRVYATVLAPGTITAGDRVLLEPPG